VPSNIKTPEWFVDQARPIAQAAGLTVTVLDEHELAAQGFGGIVAVGRGSATPPRLLQLGYTPARSRRSTPHVVLVGKGITFDSGGLSIKPGDLMANMKRDMSGGAVVLSVLAALADVDCPVRVTGLIPLAENMISGDAMRPGDVITHYGGRTTEVTNTDAEGRLVLADGVAYAVSELKPDVLVDVATLTGAVRVALGQRIGGVFASDDALFAQLRDAGAAAGEPLWRLPLVEEYEDRLSSEVADADNSPGSAQAIVAGLFLQHFTDGLPWAHLDLASVGDSGDRDEWTAGPTGFGPRALLYWLEQREPLAGVL
jgi:leucyl aminopeptidase